MSADDSKKLPIPTEAELAEAKRLAGQSWHSLTDSETKQAILFQRVYGIIRESRDGRVGSYVGLAAEFA